MIEVVRLGKGPQNARVEDNSLGGVGIDGQFIGDLAVKAAILIINGVLEPEGKNVGE